MADIPSDDCSKYYGCEERNDCGGTQSQQITDISPETKKTLQQLQICVEKFNSNPIQNAKFLKGDQYQRAAFLKGSLWDIKDTIKISFMPLPDNYPGKQPQWNGGFKSIDNKNLAMGVTNSDINTQGNCFTDGDCMNTMGTEFKCVNNNCVQDIMPIWYTKDIVTYNSNESLTPEEEQFEEKVRTMEPVEAIKYIVTEKLQPLISLKLEFVEEGGDIRIKLDNRDGAWSMVGTQCRTVPSDQATMSFGWLDVATIIHEFCHSLGMIHEHQNPKGEGIDWNIQKVFDWASVTQGWSRYVTCVNIIQKYKLDSINGSQYDSKSVMLYSFPGTLTNNNVGTKRNIKLSTTDKEWLQKMYPQDGPRDTTDNTDNTDNKNKEINVNRSGKENSSSKKYTNMGFWIFAGILLAIILVKLYLSFKIYKKI